VDVIRREAWNISPHNHNWRTGLLFLQHADRIAQPRAKAVTLLGELPNVFWKIESLRRRNDHPTTGQPAGLDGYVEPGLMKPALGCGETSGQQALSQILSAGAESKYEQRRFLVRR
jgi:hypothetical protein